MTEPTPSSPGILVFEDDLSFQKLIRARLQQRWPKSRIMMMDPTRGTRIDPDFDGAGFDVVLLDYQLGALNGLDLLKQLRKNKNFPPVIMITAQGDEKLAVAAVRAGATDYISKQTLTQEILVGAIEQALAAQPVRPEQTPGPAPGRKSRLPAVDGYELLEAIGRGKAGQVFRATRNKDGQDVALKIMHIEISTADNEELIDRCMREFSLMQTLTTAHVARIYEQRFTDDGMITAMELLPLGNLYEATRKAKLTLARALKLIRSTAQALHDIHAAGVIHRDLKPSNIMLRDENTVALIDFGVAREIEGASTLTHAGRMLGTPTYVSPEQGRGEKVDARTDLYSLGVVLYELLMHEVPYKALTNNAMVQKHIHAPLPELPVPLWLYQGLIERLMAKDPKQRYKDADEFIADLDGLAGAEG